MHDGNLRIGSFHGNTRRLFPVCVEQSKDDVDSAVGRSQVKRCACVEISLDRAIGVLELADCSGHGLHRGSDFPLLHRMEAYLDIDGHHRTVQCDRFEEYGLERSNLLGEERQIGTEILYGEGSFRQEDTNVEPEGNAIAVSMARSL